MKSNLGSVFTDSPNALNLIRLLLAGAVVVSHAWPLGSLGPEPRIGTTTLGTVAVASFFGLSGFLITGSAQRLPTRLFLWHRILRLLPGFYVCLFVIALVVAPIAWLAGHASLADYPISDAASYVVKNLGLKAGFAPTIAGTQEEAPAAVRAWNGASWSLFFEGLCYLAAALLGRLNLLTVRVVAALFVLASVLLVAWEVFPGPLEQVVFRSHDAYRLITTGCLFSAGALLWLLRARVILNFWLFVSCAVLTTAGLLFLSHPEWLVAVPLVYVLMFLSLRIPRAERLPKADFSFGVYIYGFPIASLLTVLGVNSWGVAPYLAMTIAILVPVAVASWYFIEKPALLLKRIRLPSLRPKRRAGLSAHGG